ncbi:YshB family small membrane protein [Pantoea eucrina]|uniref:YshB family small membrane protein n=1 Tax=Pantoea eucrina TaxID=472693 RepID=A0ABS1Z8L0_9GAMM|nr:YshB family small membrane protein [Pantoea eucrina]MBM0748766.1 YshB family small membrane protein [Pantoea eucrina]UBB13224.1 YshB family small membrane protein [Pantoea eucrina]
MLQSVMLTIAHNLAAIGSAVAHSPQTALAAMVCAITASLFS